jgi:hypothetical protein
VNNEVVVDVLKGGTVSSLIRNKEVPRPSIGENKGGTLNNFLDGAEIIEVVLNPLHLEKPRTNDVERIVVPGKGHLFNSQTDFVNTGIGQITTLAAPCDRAVSGYPTETGRQVLRVGSQILPSRSHLVNISLVDTYEARKVYAFIQVMPQQKNFLPLQKDGRAGIGPL